MLYEKVVEYSPWLSLVCNALSLGFRLGQIGCALTNHNEAAEHLRLIAISIGQVGVSFSFVDAGMMCGIYAVGSNEFFGDSASWTRMERLATYMLSTTNAYLAFKDKYSR